ncbi:MAG: hypothetical protein KGN84_10845 [Acidobacteriota bacterium]|nr:hypothetical protein [Acidobacteriota bacterium]
MTVLVDKCDRCFKTCFGAGEGKDSYRPEKVIARDVVCPDGHHTISQTWTVKELRHLLDAQAPVFRCDRHAYAWNPEEAELQHLRELCNAFDGGGLP